MVSVRARVASDTKTVRKDRRPVATAAAPSFDVVADIAWSKLYWASDPDWTPAADGAEVSSWRNAGSVAGDLEWAYATERPTYAESYANLNGAPAIVHDGTNDRLMTAAFTGIPQPWTWVIVVYVPAVTGSKSYGTPQFGVGASAFMGQVSGVWRFGTAVGSILTGGTATVGAHVLCGVADGANSRLLVDGAVVAAGTMAAASATRIITGYAGDGTTVAACAISLVGLYAGDFTDDAAYDGFMGWV